MYNSIDIHISNFRVASDPYADVKRTAAAQQKKTM
jgi:hypothetical protein